MADNVRRANRIRRIAVRMSDAEVNLLQELARARHISLAALVRLVLFRALESDGGAP